MGDKILTDKNILIRAKNLSVGFPVNNKQVINNASFEIRAGEFVALAGESGSGKSLLCRSILGLPPKNAIIMFDLLERPEFFEMSLIMQDSMTALDPAMPVGKQIAESIKSINKRENKITPEEYLARVGIDNANLRARQYPGEFSGGMRQRAAVAVALAMRPKIIFADEPTTSLDAEIRLKIIELIDNIRREENAAVLFVTHDLELVRGFADRVFIMQDGQITEQNILENKSSEYNNKPANNLNINTNKPIVELIDFCKYYPLGRGRINKVLDNINFAVYSGETLGLCGISGIGKSTLARCAAGLEKPSGGKRYAKNKLNIQMIFQDSASAFNPRMTAGQIIAEPFYLRNKKSPPRDFIIDLMRKTELEPELILRKPRELSGGQRQRLAIARAIAAEPDLIIADEPVSSLDSATCVKIIDLLKRLKDERGLTMILISHDSRLLAGVSDRIINMPDY